MKVGSDEKPTDQSRESPVDNDSQCEMQDIVKLNVQKREAGDARDVTWVDIDTSDAEGRNRQGAINELIK